MNQNLHAWQFLKKYIREVRGVVQGPLGTVQIGTKEIGRDGHSYNVTEGIDHNSICKPVDKRSRSYHALTDFAKRIEKDAQVRGLLPLALKLPVYCTSLS
jgi:hypothetical protein